MSDTFKHFIKLILYPVFYWVLLFMLPIWVIFPTIVSDGGWVIIYLVVLPFLFFGIYKLARPTTRKERILFIVLGFLIPFLLFYYYIYLEFTKNFNPSF